MKRLFFLFIFFLFISSVFASNYKIETIGVNSKKWTGVLNSNYVWEGEQLVWERIVKDEDGKEQTVKTYKEPYEIIADFKSESKVFGVEGNIERNAVKKFGGALKGFVWLDNVSGGGEVILPFTAKHIFIAIGDRLNPELTEIGTDPNSDNYYELVKEDIDGELIEPGKTRIVVKSFSGIGGAAGQPPTLIAHYKMNDNAPTAVVVDETGDHHGEYQINNTPQNTDTGNETGKILGALDFVGGVNGEMVVISDHDDFTPALTPFSISAWVNMHDVLNFYLTSKGIQNINGEWFFGTGINNKKLSFRVSDNSATAYIGRRYQTDLDAYVNQWIHMVGTYDGGALSSGIRIYLNAVRVDDGANWETGTFVAVENLAAPVYIGRYSSIYANGLIDGVVFFSVELTADEVNILFNNNSGTEIIEELDSKISPRRGNLSPLPLRRRWEF